MALIGELDPILNQLRAQYLPEGGTVLLLKSEELKEHSCGGTFDMMEHVSQIIVQKEHEVYVLVKMTPQIFLKVKIVGEVNIGILRNAGKKIVSELRKHKIQFAH